MRPEDALPTIAEIAVTLAGFTGILLAIQSNASNRIAGQSDRFLAVLMVPANVLLCALLPFGLAGFSASPRVVWGIPLCTHALLGGFLVSRTIARIARAGIKFTWPAAAYISLAGSAVLHLLALGSGLGFLLPHSPGVLVLSLIWSLLAAAFALVAAAVVEGRAPAAQQGAAAAEPQRVPFDR